MIIQFHLIFIFLKLECLTANIVADGLGPCKRATQAPHGTIHITFPAIDQTAVIAITANSPVNTRVRLICTDLTSVGVFTARKISFFQVCLQKYLLTFDISYLRNYSKLARLLQLRIHLELRLDTCTSSSVAQRPTEWWDVPGYLTAITQPRTLKDCLRRAVCPPCSQIILIASAQCQ